MFINFQNILRFKFFGAYFLKRKRDKYKGELFFMIICMKALLKISR